MSRDSSGSRLRGVRLALVHLACAGAIGAHVAVPFLLPQGARSDFGYFHASAVAVVGGASPYASPGSAAGIVNLNPPFQTVLMAPLGLLPYAPAMWIWYGLSLACGVLAGIVLARTFVPERRTIAWGPLFATLLLLFLPTLANAWLQQLGLVLALVAAVTLHLVARQRLLVAAAVLGLASGVKLFVGLFAVYFLLTRRWRALAGFAVAFAATVLAGALLIGWGGYPDYLALLGRVDWHAWSWNVSVFGTTTRALGSSVSQGLLWDVPDLGLPVARVLALALGVAYASLILTRGARRVPVVTGLGVSLTWVVMILLSPLGWLYYLPALLPSCALLVTAARPGRERRWSVAAVVTFLALATVPQQPYPGPDLTSPGFDWWKAELPALGLASLAATHAWLLWRRAGTAPDGARIGEHAAAGRAGPTPLRGA